MERAVFLLEKDNKLARTSPVFCSTEAKNIDTHLPADFFRRTAQRRDSVCESRAIHLDEKGTFPRELPDRGQFILRVNRAQLGRLRQTNRARLR